MKPQKVRIDLIVLDAGTQQRPIDDSLVQDYTALMKDKVEFPPVEIIRDGDKYYLWDGFHRHRCSLNLGATFIWAYVQKGDLRDAIWASFGANKKHGARWARGTAKQIIVKILTDSKWGKKSLQTIADQVGVCRDYVQQIQGQLRAKGGGQGSPPLQRAATVEATSSKGKKYEQKSQAKAFSKTPKAEPQKEEAPKDAAGNPIPKKLRPVFDDRKVVWSLLSRLAVWKQEVLKHVETRDPVFALLNKTAFEADCENVRLQLKSALPYAVCPYCGARSKDCKACQGFGILNKRSYDMAPRELKK